MPGDLPWRIEETCFNAFPSLKQVLFGDWLTRFSPGVSRRSNSVNPLRPNAADIAGALTTAEPAYRAQGQPAIFRISSIAIPAIDQTLTAAD